MRIDRSNPMPLWYQLKERLRKHIDDHLKPGDFLLAEKELALRYEVSTITVRRALEELVKEGRLKREQGKGTYVLPPPFEEGPSKLTSFTEAMSQFGLQASARILSVEVESANKLVRSKLNLPAGARVLRLTRLRLADEIPMGIQTAYLPVAFVPKFDSEELAGGSLYGYLKTRYGLYPTQAHEIYFAALIDSSQGKLLDLPGGSPGFFVERLTWGMNMKTNRIVLMEFVSSVMRGDKYRVHLELKRMS